MKRAPPHPREAINLFASASAELVARSVRPEVAIKIDYDELATALNAIVFEYFCDLRREYDPTPKQLEASARTVRYAGEKLLRELGINPYDADSDDLLPALGMNALYTVAHIEQGGSGAKQVKESIEHTMSLVRWAGKLERHAARLTPREGPTHKGSPAFAHFLNALGELFMTVWHRVPAATIEPTPGPFISFVLAVHNHIAAQVPTIARKQPTALASAWKVANKIKPEMDAVREAIRPASPSV